MAAILAPFLQRRSSLPMATLTAPAHCRGGAELFFTDDGTWFFPTRDAGALSTRPRRR
jgi:hypothetical protein